MNRRDLLLNEMNLSQWVLKKPQVLKGDVQILLDPHVKLVVVCEEDQQHSGLFQDILRSLQLKSTEYQWVNAEQAMRLHFEQSPILWIIQAQESMERLNKRYVKQTILQCPSWQELYQPQQKKALWQQIQPFCQQLENNE